MYLNEQKNKNEHIFKVSELSIANGNTASITQQQRQAGKQGNIWKEKSGQVHQKKLCTENKEKSFIVCQQGQKWLMRWQGIRCPICLY